MVSLLRKTGVWLRTSIFFLSSPGWNGCSSCTVLAGIYKSCTWFETHIQNIIKYGRILQTIKSLFFFNHWTIANKHPLKHICLFVLRWNCLHSRHAWSTCDTEIIMSCCLNKGTREAGVWGRGWWEGGHNLQTGVGSCCLLERAGSLNRLGRSRHVTVALLTLGWVCLVDCSTGTDWHSRWGL